VSRTLIPAAAVCLLLSAASAQKRPRDGTSDETIKVQVEMVSLPVVVATREGKRVTDLEQQDFQVFEDGVEQTIAGFAATDEPISVALALDTSGSTEQRLALIQKEAIQFVRMLHPDDSVAIMSFANDVSLLEDFSIDRDRNAYGIKETRPGGSTALYEAVWLALEEVLAPVRERKALVLFTDGVDTASRKVSNKETIEVAKETRATIYSVYYNTEWDARRPRTLGGPTAGGIPLPYPPVIGPLPPAAGPFPPGPGVSGDYGAGRRYLEELSEFSGGMVFNALEMGDLSVAFEQIARELASQYSIGYYSTSTKADGKFRKVEVRVRKPGLVARTKKGYIRKKEKS
jgi:VWFA-related protein